MMILISTLLFTLVVSINFGEFKATGNRRTPDLELEFMNHKIGLWVDNTRTRVTHADFQGNYVPNGDYYTRNNYLIRLVNVQGLEFVVFIKQDGSLLGVAALYPERSFLEDPEPNEATWYIAYEKRYIRLLVNPFNESFMEMILTPRNLPHSGLTPEPVEVAGIRFFVFKNENGIIVAASLAPR